MLDSGGLVKEAMTVLLNASITFKITMGMDVWKDTQGMLSGERQPPSIPPVCVYPHGLWTKVAIFGHLYFHFFPPVFSTLKKHLLCIVIKQ